MLFLPKNDSLIVNILTVIEHSVKNKEKCEVSRVFLKIWKGISHPWIFLLSLMVKEMRIRGLLMLSY